MDGWYLLKCPNFDTNSPLFGGGEAVGDSWRVRSGCSKLLCKLFKSFSSLRYFCVWETIFFSVGDREDIYRSDVSASGRMWEPRQTWKNLMNLLLQSHPLPHPLFRTLNPSVFMYKQGSKWTKCWQFPQLCNSKIKEIVDLQLVLFFYGKIQRFSIKIFLLCHRERDHTLVYDIQVQLRFHVKKRYSVFPSKGYYVIELQGLKPVGNIRIMTLSYYPSLMRRFYY